MREARVRLSRDPERSWAAYVAGALVVLQHEHRHRPRHGLKVLLRSSVPIGKGVSSSAALEVAAFEALASIAGLEIDDRSLALLAQKVENLVVGAPCGVMDQMTAACGRRGHLLELLCQPAEVVGHVALPPSLELFGVDSGIAHEVSRPSTAACAPPRSWATASSPTPPGWWRAPSRPAAWPSTIRGSAATSRTSRRTNGAATFATRSRRR